MSNSVMTKPGVALGNDDLLTGDTNPASIPSTAPADGEIIGGYQVHPAASVMPTMPEDQFDELVKSIAERGLGEPIEFKDDLLVEGRHRLRAILLLRDRGVEVELRTTAWQPLPGETVAEYVERKNLHRRHMTDGQRLQCAAELQMLANEERTAAGYASGRIQPGEVRNPVGSNQHRSKATKEDGDKDSTPPSDRRARNKAKEERSAAGQLAAKTRQSIHKARQALEVQKNGTSEEIADVKAGRKSQPEVLKAISERKGKSSAKRKQAKPVDHPFKPATPLEHDLLKFWVRFRDSKVAIAERAEARDAMRAILNAEEKKTSPKKGTSTNPSKGNASSKKSASGEGAAT